MFDWPGTGQPSPAYAQATTTDAGISSPLEVYRNGFEGFSITLSAGWVAHETGRLDPLVLIQPGSGADVRAEVTVYRLEDSPTLREWVLGEVSSYGAPVVASSSVALGAGTLGYRAELDWKPKTRVAIKELWTGVVRDGQGFIIRAFGISSAYEELLADVTAMIDSFTLEERGARPPSSDEFLSLWGCRWSTIMSVVNRSGKMSVHERIDIDPERTGKAPSAQRYPGRSDISG